MNVSVILSVLFTCAYAFAYVVQAYLFVVMYRTKNMIAA